MFKCGNFQLKLYACHWFSCVNVTTAMNHSRHKKFIRKNMIKNGVTTWMLKNGGSGSSLRAIWGHNYRGNFHICAFNDDICSIRSASWPPTIRSGWIFFRIIRWKNIINSPQLDCFIVVTTIENVASWLLIVLANSTRHNNRQYANCIDSKKKEKKNASKNKCKQSKCVKLKSLFVHWARELAMTLEIGLKQSK